jgi:hypothetical protein
MIDALIKYAVLVLVIAFILMLGLAELIKELIKQLQLRIFDRFDRRVDAMFKRVFDW